MGHSRPEAASPSRRVAHYEILEEIGRGGMGVVYRARDVTLGRDVALKCARPDRDDAQERKRLLREARAASRVSHPSIVRILEAFEEDGVLWLAMELVDGGSLRGVLPAGHPLPLDEALGHAQALASALEAAHARKVLHRDVNPNNILVTLDGRALLTDFGLARVLGISERSSTGTQDSDAGGHGRVAGTPHYMSPEQALGKRLDTRSDLFSLGAVIYEMCTGKAAFGGDGPAGLDTLLHGQPVSMSRLNYQVPEELERIVRKALSKDPEDRYQTARELLVDIRTLRRRLDHEDYSESHPDGAPVRRRVRSWMVVAAVLVAVAGLATVLGPRLRHSATAIATAPSTAMQTQPLAVVPFENATGDPAWTHLANGVTDDLSRELQQAGVAVRSRESAEQLRGLSDAQIASRLGVARVARGTISLDGADILLDARVQQVSTGGQVWSRSYRQPLGRLGGLYAAVAADIAAATLGARPDERHDGQIYQMNLKAYDAYHTGRVYWEQRDKESLLKSIEYFKKAIGEDRQYAQAWAGMADAYYGLAVPTYGALRPQDARRLGNEAALRALAIEPNLVEVQVTIAYVLYAFDWNWVAAENGFQKAIARNPQYARAHHWYADYLTAMGRYAEAMSEIRKAVELEPLAVLFQRDVAWHQFFARDYPAAIKQLQDTLRANPRFAPARSLLGRALVEVGRYDEGIAELNQVAPNLPRVAAVPFLAYAEAAAGRPAKAEAMIEDLLASHSRDYVSPYYVALVYARLDRRDEALDWLEKGVADQDPAMTTLNVDPRLDPLRSEPRFRELVQRMNFPKVNRR